MIRLFIKDLRLFIVDKQAVLSTFLLPIILITLFSLAFGGFGRASDDAASIDLMINDEDKSVASRELISALDSAVGFAITLGSSDESNEEVSSGKLPAALVIHKGYEDSLSNGAIISIELLLDRAKQVEVAMIRSLLSDAFRRTIKPEWEQAAALKTGSQKLTNSSRITINDTKTFDESVPLKLTSIVGEKDEANLGLIQAVAGTAILMLLFSVAALGTSILQEKESGTLNRLLYSPLNINTILMGKMIYAGFMGIVQLTVMFVFAWLVFGLDIFINFPALIAMIMATAFAVAGFGIFLAAITKTRQQAQNIGTLIILIMSATGGSIIPLFAMPAIMKKIAVFSVNYWGVQGFYDIFWRNLSFIEIAPRMLVLVGIGLVLSIISFRLLNRNILKLA